MLHFWRQLIMNQLRRGRFAARLALGTALGLFAGIGGLPVHAQNAQGTMVGHVQDPTGAVVPHAKVSVKEVDTGVVRTVYTNATGDYYVPDLNPGSYSITVTAPGFST